MILLLLVLALLVLLVTGLARLIRADGYGTTPPPSSWPVDPRLPSRPYGYR